MGSSRNVDKDETDFLHHGHRSTGSKYSQAQHASVSADRTSGALALDLPSARATGATPLRACRQGSSSGSQTFGMLLLLVVAALWGTNGPVLKFLFSQPSPPSAALLTACQALLAAAFLLAGTLGTPAPAEGFAASAVATSSGSGAFPRSRLDRLMRPGPGQVPGQGLAAQLRRAIHLSSLSGLWLRLRLRIHSGRGAPRREPLFPPREPPESIPHCHSSSVALGLTHPHATHHHATHPHNHLLQDDQRQHQDQQHPHPHGGQGGPMAGCTGRVSYDGHTVKVRSARGNGANGGPEGPTSGAALGSGSLLGAESGSALEQEINMNKGSSGPAGSGGGTTCAAGVTAASVAVSAAATCGSPAAKSTARSKGSSFRRLGPAAGAYGSNLLALPVGRLTTVGLELGAYNFCAVALGTWGVQCLSATKVAFLGQATSLITPLLVALSGERVAAGVWAACCCGVFGGALVAVDGAGRSVAATASTAAATAAGGSLESGLESGLGIGASPSSLSRWSGAVAASRSMRLEGSGPAADGYGGSGGGGGGRVGGLPAAHAMSLVGALTHNTLQPALSRESMGVNYVLASCVFYALSTVRVGAHSGRFPSLQLAAAGTVGYAVLAVVWLLLDMAGSPSGGRSDLHEVAALLHDSSAVALVLWAGFGPGALSSYLQVLGQRIVPAAQAQMLYSSTPLWSALIARLLLRGRDGGMGPLAWLGGALMLGASLLASLLPGAGAAGSKPGVAASPAGTVEAASGAAKHQQQQCPQPPQDQPAGLGSVAGPAGSRHPGGGVAERRHWLENGGGVADKVTPKEAKEGGLQRAL